MRVLSNAMCLVQAYTQGGITQTDFEVFPLSLGIIAKQILAYGGPDFFSVYLSLPLRLCIAHFLKPDTYQVEMLLFFKTHSCGSIVYKVNTPLP